MATTRLKIDGYGQLELNNVAFRRDGRIEAQCALDPTDFKDVPAENGMLLAVDNVNRTVKFVKDGVKLPIALLYSSEKLPDERADGLKNFKMEAGEGYLPRLGYLSVGDKFITNTVSYESETFGTLDAFKAALGQIATTPLYGTTCDNGTIFVTKTAPESGVYLLVIDGPGAGSMPDGQLGIKFQVVSC